MFFISIEDVHGKQNATETNRKQVDSAFCLNIKIA